MENGNSNIITGQRRRISDLEGPTYFVPLKPYDGVIRVILDIEYQPQGGEEGSRQEIRGVIPIVLRTDPQGSYTGATGTFDMKQNLSVGRKAGDRGFRPDIRTNLYFRELMQ